MRKSTNKRAIGTKYEEKAISYLIDMGYRIIQRNYRCKLGEIDIIAAYNSYLIFIEVKYRYSNKNGSPLEAVTSAKQRIICKVADYYRLTHRIEEETPCRFDVIGITNEEIQLVEDAFPYCGW